MGAVICILLRSTRAAPVSLERANRAAILRQARAVLEHYTTVTESLHQPRLPPNFDRAVGLNRLSEGWARISINYHERGTEHEINFSIFNQQNQQILSGILYTDTSVNSDVQIAIQFINRSNGEFYGITLVLPIDLQAVFNLFY